MTRKRYADLEAELRRTRDLLKDEQGALVEAVALLKSWLHVSDMLDGQGNVCWDGVETMLRRAWETRPRTVAFLEREEEL